MIDNKINMQNGGNMSNQSNQLNRLTQQPNQTLNDPNKYKIESLQNLLENGIFDSTSAPWTSGQSGTMAQLQYPVPGYIGNAIGITYPSYEPGAYAYWTQTIWASPGNYTLSGVIKSNNVTGPGGAYLLVEYLDTTGTTITSYGTTLVTGTTPWTHYSGTFTAPTGTVYAMISFMFHNSPGTVAVDDIWFMSVTPPPPVVCKPVNAGLSYPGSATCADALTTDNIVVQFDVQFDQSDVGKQYNVIGYVSTPSGIKTYGTGLSAITGTYLRYTIGLSSIVTVVPGSYYIDHVSVLDSAGNTYCSGSPFPTTGSGLCAIVKVVSPGGVTGYSCTNCNTPVSCTPGVTPNCYSTSSACQSSCGGGVTGYSCTNCNTSVSCTPGVTPNCYSTPSACQTACTGGGGGAVVTCTPSCAQDEICLAPMGFGCQKRTYIVAGIGAIVLIAVLKG